MGVRLAVIPLGAVGEADPGVVDPPRLKQPLGRGTPKARLDDELGADAPVLLGVLVATDRPLVGVEQLPARLNDLVDRVTDLGVVRGVAWHRSASSRIGFPCRDDTSGTEAASRIRWERGIPKCGRPRAASSKDDCRSDSERQFSPLL